jgi:starch synthase (maltosyl-transferring)
LRPLYIYNIFPRLFKNIKNWNENLDRIKDMGFNCIFINSILLPGFSGSIYAVKDHYKYNESFFEKNKSFEEQLKNFISNCKSKNLEIIIDLIINHTSKDSNLTNEHKNWYKLDENDELITPGVWQDGKMIKWNDLAVFDIDNSTDKKNLWDYLLNIGRHFLKLGFTGFRCDAAYQVSSEFWEFLILTLKKEFKDTIFLAETLGCTPGHIQSLANCGFDYIYNSSKWWDFKEDWCLEQYDLNRNIASSISFPETHDTERLMADVKGNTKIFLQRLYFAAIFSKGFMIPSGFEYGFEKKLDVVSTTSDDWEKTGNDYSSMIKKILDIKKSLIPLKEESSIEVIPQINKVFVFIKEWENKKVLICINKDIKNKQKLKIENLEELLNVNKIKDYSPENRIEGYISNLEINLEPAELKIFASENYYNK